LALATRADYDARMSGAATTFPPGFLWGAATSAHQVEGGNRLNDWWRFEQLPGAIHGGDTSGDACRHYQRFDEDFALAAADGHNAHRLSIEWSRIEPERGRWNAAEVEHYHEVFASLARHRLTPVVTLHHFTIPLWIADRGGWENRDTIDRFVEFARFCAREFGGEVDWWCTVNEPEVYAFRGWSEGIWPPRRHDDAAALAVMANLLEAHGRAYRALHEDDRADADGDGFAVRAGFAKHRPQLVPARPWFPLDRLRAHFEDRVFNRAVEESAATGLIDLSIPGARGVKRSVPELEGAWDWYGLNYYTRWQVNALGPEPHTAKRGAPLNDLGWEIWPEGLADAVHRAARFGKPVLITEHGFADEGDTQRPRALSESLRALAGEIARGSSVLGYLHWSLLDNFEWSEGYRGRFGLYAVDFADPGRPRRRTRSAERFAAIARANSVIDD
jgi:beta-glucosidase